MKTSKSTLIYAAFFSLTSGGLAFILCQGIFNTNQSLIISALYYALSFKNTIVDDNTRELEKRIEELEKK